MTSAHHPDRPSTFLGIDPSAHEQSAVTLYGRVTDAGVALDALVRSAESVQVDGEPDWHSAALRYADGDLIVNRLIASPDSPGARILLGTFAHVDSWPAQDDAARSRLEGMLAGARTVLGVQVIPPMTGPHEQRWSALLRTTAAIDAVLFDGEAMRDGSGRVVLGADGRSEQ